MILRWKGDVLGYSKPESLRSVIPGDMFGLNSYEKGGYVLYMLREQIGDAAFFKTMQTYAQRFHFSNATSDDFWTVAEEVSGQDLSQFFTQWVTYTDLPHVSVTWVSHDTPNGGSQVDALICPANPKPYVLDLPVVLKPGISVTPTTLPAMALQNTSQIETIHLTGASQNLHWTAPFSVQTWSIDPRNSVLVSTSVQHVSDSLPSVCPTS